MACTITASNAGPTKRNWRRPSLDAFPAALTLRGPAIGAGGASAHTHASGPDLAISTTRWNLPGGGSPSRTTMTSCAISASATMLLATILLPSRHRAASADPTPETTRRPTPTLLVGSERRRHGTLSRHIYRKETPLPAITLTNSGAGPRPTTRRRDDRCARRQRSRCSRQQRPTGTLWRPRHQYGDVIGSIPAAGTVTITIAAVILPSTSVLPCQIRLRSRSMLSGGSNESAARTNNPAVVGTMQSHCVPGRGHCRFRCQKSLYPDSGFALMLGLVLLFAGARPPAMRRWRD